MLSREEVGWGRAACAFEVRAMDELNLQSLLDAVSAHRDEMKV